MPKITLFPIFLLPVSFGWQVVTFSESRREDTPFQCFPLPFSIILVAIQAYRWKQQEQLQEGLVWWLSILCLSAYLPFYVDGSALDGRRAGSHTKWFVKLPLWRFIWCRLLGMPECKVLWEEKQFPSVDSQGNEQRFIFCSHPHGVMSAHHIGPMIVLGLAKAPARLRMSQARIREYAET